MPEKVVADRVVDLSAICPSTTQTFSARPFKSSSTSIILADKVNLHRGADSSHRLLPNTASVSKSCKSICDRRRRLHR